MRIRGSIFLGTKAEIALKVPIHYGGSIGKNEPTRKSTSQKGLDAVFTVISWHLGQQLA